MNRKTHIVVLAGLLALFGVLLLVMPVDEYLVDFVSWAPQAGIWGGVVFGVIYAVGVAIFIPGTLLSLTAGFMFGLLWGAIIVSLAGTAGAAVAFLIGRFLVHDWVASKIEGYPKFHALYRAIDNDGFKTVVLSRLVPIFPFALVNYSFSVTRVPFGKYVVGTWLGSIPATIVYVYLGTFAGNLARVLSGGVEDSQLQDTLFIVGGIAAVLVTVVLTRQAKKEFDKITAEAAAVDEEPS
jgi:uncharacterized membrane protein YdjX (TVP38/TMEM64 family)